MEVLLLAEEIYGLYESVEEVVKTVDILELEGKSNGSITIFSHGKYADEINEKTDVSVTSTETSKDRERSFLDKITKVIFNGVDETTDLPARLREKGLTEQQAAYYTEEIKSGKLIVTVTKDLKMSNDAAYDLDTYGQRANHLNN
ncbi:Heat induced stress protein YflT [Lentibacillus persicus]|uniref:Heat induced stress protein YflT n=1 Tax=Lentibacillus persicus TaxID=640948 RepID=A0A1I1X2D4_9BACI|nr:general stress protein [Lentibacillus persicus]SFE01575.1 Heat induced stress protein YflT [Lentibacillus persicus]